MEAEKANTIAGIASTREEKPRVRGIFAARVAPQAIKKSKFTRWLAETAHPDGSCFHSPTSTPAAPPQRSR